MGKDDSTGQPKGRRRQASYRREPCDPLPEESPKATGEEAESLRRLQTIISGSSYRMAEEDVEFLARNELRGVRLLIEYLKPELVMAEHGIQHTVVVFGGTRICERAAAERKVAMLREALAADPGNKELKTQLKIAESVLAKSHYYDIAREFGRLVGETSGRLSDTVIMTGAGPGIMEAVNRGSFDAQAKSVGLNISLPTPQYPNPYVTPHLCFSFHYFALRKLHLLHRARALVAFPGGYGTLDELFEVLTLVQTGKMRPIPVVLVGEKYWRRLVDIDFLVDEGVIDPEDRDLFWFAETAQETWDSIQRWYEHRGEA